MGQKINTPISDVREKMEPCHETTRLQLDFTNPVKDAPITSPQIVNAYHHICPSDRLPQLPFTVPTTPIGFALETPTIYNRTATSTSNHFDSVGNRENSNQLQAHELSKHSVNSVKLHIQLFN
jgi:hypothetical protein